METNDEFQERIRREQRLTARLRLATERLEEAQRERIWAVVEAHQSGLSIRQIAAATGFSASRIHQLLGSDEAREIPRWLSQRRDQEAAPSQGRPDLRARLAGEMDALRRCREWLERLERGEPVVVNLRPEGDPETEYVSFDRPRVLRVLARIIADLDGLAGFPPIAEEAKKGSTEARRSRHRRRLAEPDPSPKRLTRCGKSGPPSVPCWIFRSPRRAERIRSRPTYRADSAHATRLRDPPAKARPHPLPLRPRKGHDPHPRGGVALLDKRRSHRHESEGA